MVQEKEKFVLAKLFEETKELKEKIEKYLNILDSNPKKKEAARELLDEAQSLLNAIIEAISSKEPNNVGALVRKLDDLRSAFARLQMARY